MKTKENRIRAFLVDDEPLALKRLEALLEETERVNVAGKETNPLVAMEKIEAAAPDVLFLDIKMPGLNGFELLERMKSHPPVIFTTAFDEHSLNAFEYFSVDYLLKPIEKKRLLAALDKLDRIRSTQRGQIGDLIRELRRGSVETDSIKRISSRVGSKVHIIDINEVTHFISEDKVTFAVTADGKRKPVDLTLKKLEKSLGTGGFMRIHRSTIVNLEYVGEVHGWFSGGVLLRLNDLDRTDLPVARSRVRKLKSKLGMK